MKLFNFLKQLFAKKQTRRYPSVDAKNIKQYAIAILMFLLIAATGKSQRVVYGGALRGMYSSDDKCRNSNTWQAGAHVGMTFNVAKDY